jgi:hypothetical protein
MNSWNSLILLTWHKSINRSISTFWLDYQIINITVCLFLCEFTNNFVYRALEDEYHLFLNCHLNQQPRNLLINTIENKCPSFTNMSPMNKLDYILNLTIPELMREDSFIKQSIALLAEDIWYHVTVSCLFSAISFIITYFIEMTPNLHV